MTGVEDLYQLSPVQRGFFAEATASRDPGAQMVQLVYELGAVDLAAFRAAWRFAIARHAALRTSFHRDDLEEPLQVVHGCVDVQVDASDWRGLANDEREASLQDLLDADRRRGVTFDTPPLYRLRLIRVGASRSLFLWSFHHILFEGWSAALILQEVLACYRARLAGAGDPTLPPPPSFSRYIGWLQEQATAPAEAFWRTRLAGFGAPTPLPHVARTRSSVHQVQRHAGRALELSEEETRALVQYAKVRGLTLNTVVQGAWALLLAKTGGVDDVLFGTMVSGRSAPVQDIERMVGLFINLLPSRVRVDAEAPLGDWLAALQRAQARDRGHGYWPLVQVKEWSEVPPGVPLFETLVIFENWFGDLTLSGAEEGLEVHGVRGHHGGPGFPLALVAWPGDRLNLAVSYDADLYDELVAEALLGRFARLLVDVAGSGSRARVADLPLLDRREWPAQVAAWNPQPLGPPPEGGVHAVFHDQAARTPDAIAVALGEHSITYRELARRARHLTGLLRSHGVGPESLVGICLSRSIEAVAAIWGVLGTGGAYVPLDPALPRQRLAFVLADARIEVLLTEEALADGLRGEAPHVVAVDSALGGAEPPNGNGDPAPVRADQLAYVTYTSGSTGKPKGSMVLHGGLLNALDGWNRAYDLATIESHLVLASFAVDVFTADVVRAHCSGGRLVLVPEEDLLAPARVADLLIDEGIGYAEFVPQTLAPVLARLRSSGSTLPDLRFLVVGSDVWAASEWERARDVLGERTRLVNAYGLNETSVDCTYFEDPGDAALPAAYAPIGKPFANHRIYVLDERLRPVPDGVVGELYVGGLGVARGYWRRPRATAERFLPDPFTTVPGARMCRTGDRVRVLAGGDLELLGRVDDQVKIRAYRVELSEVECALLSHPEVVQAVAAVRTDDTTGPRLVAYLVCAREVTAATIRRFVAERLPSYMVPSAIVFLEAMPMTDNRLKIDRNALPSPPTDLRPDDDEIVPLRTETERRLGRIWGDVLSIDEVGRHDNFMDLGGHSLLLVKVLERIEDQWGFRPHPGDLILPTLSQLAATIDTRSRGSAAPQPAGKLRRLFRRE